MAPNSFLGLVICTDYQLDTDSSNHWEGYGEDNHLGPQDLHPSGNEIYMDDCWVIIAEPS